MVLTRELAHTIVGIIGNVISFGLFFSPAPTFYKIIKKKSTEEFKPDPYLATVLNCLLWVFYGLPFIHPDSILVVTINAIGLVFEFSYLAIFVLYATANKRKKVGLWLLAEGIFFAGLVAVVLLKLHGTTHRSLVVGILCDIFNIIMYASPLTVWSKVIKSKSVKYMPFTLSLANFLNGLCWTAYALIKFDFYILLSNGLGTFFGLIQLILYGYYWKYGVQEVEDDQKVEKPSEVELAQP